MFAVGGWYDNYVESDLEAYRALHGKSGLNRVLVGPWALFVWLRLIGGLVFPLVVSWAAVQTAKTRSMESATGQLYINVGAIAAGTILASS